MYPWQVFWAPQVHFPFANFAQTVEPITDWFFGAIPKSAGDAQVERQAVNVASYGRQLGWITEVLLDMAAQTPPDTPQGRRSLARLADIKARIDALKEQDAQSLVDDIEDKLALFERKYKKKYPALQQGLRKALAGPAA